MDVTFIGIVCFIDNKDGSFTAALPDGTKGSHPCPQGGGKTDAHFPLICALGVTDNSKWPDSTIVGECCFLPIPEPAALTIGDIAQGPGVDTSAFGGLRSLQAWDNQFNIDFKGRSYRANCITWVDISDGALITDVTGKVHSTMLQVNATGKVRVTLHTNPQRSVDVDHNGSISILNTSWGPHKGVSHFFLYYRLDTNPHCATPPVRSRAMHSPILSPRLNKRGRVIMTSLVADCSNTTYP
jgi:hypothetical protein